METEFLTGVPTMCFLPARNYQFTVSDVVSIELPVKGKFVDLDPEYFKDSTLEFELVTEGIINITSISRILFSIGKYPDLKDNEIFCPINFIINDKSLLITGQVVTMLHEDTDESL